MRRTSVAIAIALCCLPLPVSGFDLEGTMGSLKSLLKGADVRDGERAAFIVEDADGICHLVLWPQTNERLGATWHGAIPEGTVAIAHTHPVAMPQPSGKDIALAARLGLPLVVVSQARVYVVDQTGAVTLFAKGGWQKRYSARD